MSKKWYQNLDEEILNFFHSLKKNNNIYQIFPVSKGGTRAGNKLELGYSCLALKSFFITGNWDKLSLEQKEEWKNFIQSFQISKEAFPKNSYIDEELLKGYNQLSIERDVKRIIKSTLNIFNKYNFESHQERLKKAVRAESKQALSTLHQVDFYNHKPYFQFPQSKEDLQNFLTFLNWNKPWSAGAQFAGLCLFTSLLDDKKKKNEATETLNKFSDNLVNKDGTYYFGTQKDNREIINGVMKMISGFDWIGKEIHYPDKIIDLCLETSPSHEGCDLVDIVYVLYMSSKETTYKRKEIIDYLKDLLPVIELHYKKEYGGFSYYMNKSQKYYYGLNITKGFDTPDVHGTTLLLWALSMIFSVTESGSDNWKVLKP